MKLKIWLDDQYDDAELIDRHPPFGYHGTTSVLECARLIKEGKVEHISFDHDLGKRSPFTGYTLARLVEKWAFEKKCKRFSWDVHSKNTVGAENIQRAMKKAEQYWTINENPE